MLFAIFLFALSWVHTLSTCKYITHEGRSYQLDQCSYSSYAANISWGFYCEELNDSMIAVYKQWNGIQCAPDTSPSVQLYEIPCDGEESQSCDCIGFGGAEEDCSIGTLVVEDCDDYTNQTVTRYAINLCRAGDPSDDTSQQVVCDGGSKLQTMAYENEECDKYGYPINAGEFDVEKEDVCGFIMCQSTANKIHCLSLAVVVLLLLFS